MLDSDYFVAAAKDHVHPCSLLNLRDIYVPNDNFHLAHQTKSRPNRFACPAAIGLDRQKRPSRAAGASHWNDRGWLLSGGRGLRVQLEGYFLLPLLTCATEEK
ncbi:hypothetical protein AVEN_13472-1 [Araneus ventricosus]|uniref:Uncharacterized protein n=1 Tax=Araneus ventricosus TaxID=182803 RepID=A0A4Y2IVS7_ARAVE|nr:hypothetical protein AVEN_13472-1 [Araneus ventricosus]